MDNFWLNAVANYFAALPLTIPAIIVLALIVHRRQRSAR